jgi:methylisocitrate lyase
MKPTDQSSVSVSRRLREAFAAPEILVAPGAYDAITARAVAQHGFDAVYVTGAGTVNAQYGLPDVGLITLTEMSEAVGRICDAVDIPVFSDADTGYGNEQNVARTVRAFEKAGAAGLHIEDQISEKRCGHLADKELIPAEEMCLKIAAAVEARTDPDFVLIVRTDAIGPEGYEAGLQRTHDYARAGADVIFIEALNSREEFARYANEAPDLPLLANMTEFGKTPFFTASEFEAMGYRMVIWPVSSLRVANKAQQHLFTAIKRDGGTHKMVDQMQTRAELYATIGLHNYEALDASIIRTIIPEGMPLR